MSRRLSRFSILFVHAHTIRTYIVSFEVPKTLFPTLYTSEYLHVLLLTLEDTPLPIWPSLVTDST